jgi:glycosyltransferase involved in cell wall biosynthesis
MSRAAPSRVLVWQWGRFGAGPRIAACLARGLAELPGVEVFLSLSRGAEILRDAAAPRCDLPVDTYASVAGFVARAAAAPFALPGLIGRIKRLRPKLAICAMPGPLDLEMAAALRWLNIPFVVVVHDADAHLGDGMPMQMPLQRALCRRANAVVALTAHVGEKLLSQGLARTPDRKLIRLRLPPLRYDFTSREAAAADGGFRLLTFGRLLPYKGLDLLAESLKLLGAVPGLTVRVVGSGPESHELSALRALPGVTVENRWVPEAEVGALFVWADAVVLPYREASQSGVAAVALAANRYVVSTNVGGLAEQLRDEQLAILCEPDAVSLAGALRRVLDAPPVGDAKQCPDDDWRKFAAELLEAVASDQRSSPGGRNRLRAIASCRGEPS